MQVQECECCAARAVVKLRMIPVFFKGEGEGGREDLEGGLKSTSQSGLGQAEEVPGGFPGALEESQGGHVRPSHVLLVLVEGIIGHCPPPSRWCLHRWGAPRIGITRLLLPVRSWPSRIKIE